MSKGDYILVEPRPNHKKYQGLKNLSSAELRDELKDMEKRFKWFKKHSIPELWQEIMKDPKPHTTETWKKHSEAFAQYLGMTEVSQQIISILKRKHESARVGPFTRRALKMTLEKRRKIDSLTDIIEGVILIELLRGEGYKEILETLHQGPEELTEHNRFMTWWHLHKTFSWPNVGKNKTTRGLFQKWMTEVKKKYAI